MRILVLTGCWIVVGSLVTLSLFFRDLIRVDSFRELANSQHQHAWWIVQRHATLFGVLCAITFLALCAGWPVVLYMLYVRRAPLPGSVDAS